MFDLHFRANFAVATGLAVSLTLPTFAHAGAPPRHSAVAVAVVGTEDAGGRTQPQRASLQVDISALGNKGKPLANQVQSRADALLRELEFLPAREANDLLILVKITGIESEPGYNLDFSGLRAGRPQENPVTQATCRLCTDGEVVDLFATRMREYLAHAREQASAPAEPAQGSAQEPASADLAPKVQIEVRDRQSLPNKTPSQPPQKLGAMGWSGVGLLAGGAVFLGGGLGMALAGKEHDGVVLTHDYKTRHELRPSGVALASVGAAALVTGVVLIVLDRVQGRRRSH